MYWLGVLSGIVRSRESALRRARRLAAVKSDMSGGDAGSADALLIVVGWDCLRNGVGGGWRRLSAHRNSHGCVNNGVERIPIRRYNDRQHWN